MALAAVDAPQGCADALIAVSPALQREGGPSDRRGQHLPKQSGGPSRGQVGTITTKALVHTWLAYRVV